MTNLRKIREKRKLTQTAVQIETRIDQSLLSKYEHGVRMPTYDHLFTLAKFYNTSLDFLLDWTDEETPYPRKK
ncbi:MULTISPECIES: helix-turn-helix domain-containing protein [Anaerotruncus]|uniref:helix-turn-helix domain-containing protein n=1 Tax=Anaerotruncus TaxID=244127 RepID=UPI0008318FD0|nr:helix-turn-helix transcriptional regulator [Anaerotruncus rubiinfantis]RGX56728.1 XRE family transcriptional regulator [Anaerotruncus sp. AF02-27]